ncbi:hypothetical protein [Streptomyces sp. NPDC056431]
MTAPAVRSEGRAVRRAAVAEPALWSSEDGGRTFMPRLTVSRNRAAYSDLVQLDEATIGLLHGTGTGSAYETVEFRRIPPAAVTGSAGRGP